MKEFQWHEAESRVSEEEGSVVLGTEQGVLHARAAELQGLPVLPKVTSQTI